MRKRRVLWPIFAFVILLAIMLTVLSFMITRTDFVESRVASLFKNIIESTFNVTVSIGETEGNIFKGYTFYDIELIAQDSIVVGKATYVAVTFAPQELVGARKIIRKILVHEPVFDFTRIPPGALLRQKQPTEEEKAPPREDEKKTDDQGIAFESISISKGTVHLAHGGRVYSIKDLFVDGKVYLSPVRTRIIVDESSAELRGITAVKTLSGTVIFKDDMITLLDCVCKTNESSFTANGTLFDEDSTATLTIQNLSLSEASRLFKTGTRDLHGKISGSATVRGKGKGFAASANLAAANVMYGGDSLGEGTTAMRFEKNRVTISNARWELPDGQIALKGWYDMETTSFDLAAEVKTLLLHNTVARILEKSIQGKLSGTIHAKGKSAFDDARRELDIKATLKNSMVRNFSFDSLNTHVQYAGKSLTINHLLLASKGGTIRGEGTWGREKDVSIETHNFMVAPLLELAGISDINGVLRMKGRYTETEGRRAIRATIDCYEPHVKNIKANHIAADIRYNTADNFSSICIRDIDFLNTRIESLSVAFLTDSIIRTFSLTADGKDIHLSTLASVEQEAGHIAFLVDTLNLKYKEVEVANRERLRIEMAEENRFILKQAQLYLINIPVLLDLEIDKDLNYRLAMSSDNLDLRTLGELMELEKDLGGALGVRIEGAGSIRDPQLTMHLDISGFFFEEIRADDIVGTFEYRDEYISIKSLRILKGDEISEVEGRVPITVFQKQKDPSRRLELSITANDLGAWIFYPFDRFAHFEGGKVYGYVRLAGTVAKLNMTGDLRIYATNIFIPWLGIRMKETDGYIELEKDRILIQDIKAIVEDGFIDLDGEIDLKGIKPESIDLSISGEHIPITGFKDIYITVSPELQLSGPFGRLLLEGFVAVEKGDITIPFRRKIEKGIRRGGTFSYDIEIAADRGDIWLKNEDVDVEIEGNIFAKGTGNAPQLSGRFETKRGFIYYLDNTFTIERGIFRFMNSPELNPEIDLKAATKVRYTYMPPSEEKARDTTVVVYLNVGGTMQQPEFSLTASDASFNEENIILLLSLNVTSLEDITSIENVSNLSDKAASFWIRQMLLREFQTTLGVDAIDLETRLIGSEKSAKLTVGKYVSKDLYLGVTHDIFATSKDEFEIEYKVWKGSYLIGKRNEEGRYNLGVRFKFKY